MEVIGGIWANSLALLTDAAHMLTDVMSLIVAYFAMRAATAPPSQIMTYRRHRITILAALFNALTLIGIVFYVGAEGYKRLLNPQSVEGPILFIAAAIGVIGIFILVLAYGTNLTMSISEAPCCMSWGTQ